MKKYWHYIIAAMLLASPALALQPMTDYAVRSPNGSNQEIVSTVAVPGGTLYTTATMNNGVIVGSPSTAFVPVGAAAVRRYMMLTDVKSAAGVPVTATAGAGVPAISRVDATSLYIAGETTTASAVTDTALFETRLPDTYVAGSSIPVTINASVAGAGTLTAASTTITLHAYTEINGVETALTVSAAQQIVAAGSDLTFTITGTGLTPGAHIMLECIMLVTSSAGSNTGHINSVSIQG